MNQLALLPSASAPARAEAPPPAGPGPVPLVIGLDLALGLTGVAGLGWSDYVAGGNRRGEERLDYLLTRLQSFYRLADLVTIEGPSFGSRHRHDEVIALYWLVRRDLWKRGIPFAVIRPSTRVIYVLGNGQPCDPETGHRLTGDALKAAVTQATARHFGIEFEGKAKYDEADAYIVAAMGLHHLGHPQAALPDTHTRALSGVAWPERTDQ